MQIHLIAFLYNILGGQRLFKEYLQSEYSEENILFWLACEDLKLEKDPEIVEEKARTIFDDYISSSSPKEVIHYFTLEVANYNLDS